MILSVLDGGLNGGIIEVVCGTVLECANGCGCYCWKDGFAVSRLLSLLSYFSDEIVVSILHCVEEESGLVMHCIVRIV